LGDNLELLKQLEPNSIHSCVSDFPYNLGFMGKKWDTISNYYDWCFVRATELYRVLKSGGYCLIFGGTRTHHRMVCAFEDAGFEIKDEIQWIYGQGFPKSYNISKGFDKQAGAEREKLPNPLAKKQTGQVVGKGLSGAKNANEFIEPNPITDLAKQWDGWGTALKPAQEPIMVAQKPIEKNYCFNIQKYGVGGFNIDDSRIPFDMNDKNPATNPLYRATAGYNNTVTPDPNSCNIKLRKEIMERQVSEKGRFPANVIFDDESVKILDEQSGTLKSGSNCIRSKEGFFVEHGGLGKAGDIQITYADSGGASRFFYCAKANTKDKTENGLIENKHPTVKPTDLIKYLVRLVTPPNGTCIDICEGSGTHGKACELLTKEGYSVNYIGFENDQDSYDIANKRIEINKVS